MWIVALALRRPYTFVVMALVIILLMPLVILRTPVDIFPDINIPVISVVWNYTGFAPAGHGRPHRHQLRARHDHHGQRHRAHRVAVGERRRRHQDLLPAGGQYSDRAGAGDSDCADHGARPAAGHDAAAGHSVHGLDHADRAARPQQQDPARAAAVRSGPELPAHPAGDGAGRGHAVSLRRQDSPGAGRSRHAAAAGQRPVAQRHRQRHQRAEPDHSVGHRPRSARWNTRSR